MKKVLFTLVALIATMSMNAQTEKKATVMKVLDGETVLETRNVKSTIKVVFEKVAITGTAKRNYNIDVNWVQLWENGPKFAVYNVGANSAATEYGGYYCWGGHIDKDTEEAFNPGSAVLSGDDDTATKLWGDKWRMPTKEELDDLLANCDVVWTTVDGVYGRKFTGKEEPYKSNSIFLPAAGYCDRGNVRGQSDYGYYWSSTPNSTEPELKRAYHIFFVSDDKRVDFVECRMGHSVRAVLKENNE